MSMPTANSDALQRNGLFECALTHHRLTAEHAVEHRRPVKINHKKNRELQTLPTAIDRLFLGLLQTRRSKRELATNETHILKNMAFETVFLKNRLTETLFCQFYTNETLHFPKVTNETIKLLYVTNETVPILKVTNETLKL